MSKGKEQKPVILQVLPELDHGGVEVGTVQIADALRQHGIKNFVASAGGRMVHDLEKIKVPHITLPLKTKNPIKLYLNSLKLEKIIKENAGAVYQGKRHQHRARPFARTGLERLLGGQTRRRQIHDHFPRHLRTGAEGNQEIL